MIAQSIITGLAIVLILVAIAVIVRRAVRYGLDRFTLGDTVEVKSTVDGMTYRVQPAHDNPQAAADTLATLNKRVIALMRALKKKYSANPNNIVADFGAGERIPVNPLRRDFPARARAVDMLLHRYNPD